MAPRLACLIPLVLLAFSACDGASGAVEPEPDPADHLIGTYHMRMYRHHPLPYWDYRTAASVASATLELKRGRRFEEVLRRGPGSQTVTVGDYFPRTDLIALVTDAGSAKSFDEDEGILRGLDGTVFVREGGDLPPGYQWDLYTLVECDGRVPTYMERCPGNVSSSLIWLLENRRFYLQEGLVGATARRSGFYHLGEHDVIAFTSMDDYRSSGTIRNDSLVLGSWVYLKTE